MKHAARFILTILFFLPLLSKGQDVEMADTFRSDGKIYVVVAVMAIILVGLFLYLFSIGKKVSDLEKKISKKN